MSAREFGNQLLTRLLDHTVAVVPGAVGAGLSIASGDGRGADTAAPHSVAAVGVATDLDRTQWSRAAGPLWEAFRTGRLVVRPQPPEAERDADRGSFGGNGSDSENSAQARHLLGLDRTDGVPPDLAASVQGAVFSCGEWGGELPVVVSLYLSKPPDASVLQELDRQEPVLTTALALVEFCAGEEMLAEQMVQMTQYRRVIEQAKGLVMGASSCDAERAFETLARASQHFNVAMRHLAVALVEHVGGASAEHPDDPELVVRPSTTDRQVAQKVWAALTASPILGGRG